MTCPFCGAEVGNATICPQCGATFTTPSISVSLSLPLGTKLFGGKYSVGKVLGQGGFGITYMGADTVLSRPVAIKELFPEGCQRNGTTVQPTRIPPSDFSSMKQKFLDEARLLASLNHPGIVKVYDFFEENNTAYMVMEYLRGKSLAKLVEERGGALGEKEAVGYILKVCEALDVVHKAGYLHRDIKPDNIIVCGDGRVVLVDFGAARSFMAGKTGRMTVILTPGYAPYEQYATMARFGPTLDIYALGATLYYLLTGEVPISAPDRAIGVELKSVREINGRVSRQVEEAVMKAMAMRVEERPQSVGEFVGLLKGWREVATLSLKGGVSSVNFSPDNKFLAIRCWDVGIWDGVEIREVGSQWKKVASLTIWVDTVYLGYLGAIPYIDFVTFSPDGEFLIAGGAGKTIIWEVGSWGREIVEWSYSAAFSPDKKFLALGSRDGTVEIQEVGSWREIVNLSGHGSSVSSVTFSPDGKFLASGSGDNTVKVWEVESWREVVTLRHRSWVSSVSFSPDGKFLVSGSGDATVKVWEVGSWREVTTLSGHGYAVPPVSFSPDGKFLALGSEDNTVKVWEVGSWREIATLRHGGSVSSVSFSPDGKFLASGGYDKTVKVWEVESWREVVTLRHRSWVSSVSFSPDGKFLASGSDDETVKVWEVGR
jgi:WD40 repeat protein/predicted Ser/Thr protein kinase